MKNIKGRKDIIFEDFNSSILGYEEKYPLLNKAKRYIIDNNKSNNLPYHNIMHLYNVYASAKKFLAEQNEMEKNNIDELELLIACLFHDFNHTGGEKTDDVNIDLAIDGLKEFRKESNGKFDIDKCIEIIQSTQFPYIVKSEDLSDEGKIIRDCDLCALFDESGIFHLCYGLRSEMKKSMDEFLDIQQNFINSIKFETKFFQKIWNIEKDNRINDIKNIKK